MTDDDDDLGGDLEQVVADLVKKGRYPSRTALLQEGVRLVEERAARPAGNSGL